MAADFLAKLKQNLGFSASVPAIAIAGAKDGDDPTTITEAQLDTALAAAQEQGRIAGDVAGFTRANERVVAVMASDAGKANPAGALAMVTDPDLAALPADKIAAKVATFGAPVAKVEPAKTGAETDAAKKIAGETPPIKVLPGQAAGQTETGAEKGAKEEQASVFDLALKNVNSGMASSGHLPGAVL